jgi:hypothetical protein
MTIHNLELQNSKPSVPGRTLYNRVFNNIKQIANIQFKKGLKNLLRGAIIQQKTLSQ